MSLTFEEREHIRNARSDHVKSLRRRDSRMIADVQKSIKITQDQLVAEEILVDQVQSDGLNIQDRALE